MLRNRLTRLERALGELDVRTCSACLDGRHPFVVRRWLHASGHRHEEPEPNHVYDEAGRCLTCGAGCRDAVVVVLPACSRIEWGARE